MTDAGIRQKGPDTTNWEEHSAVADLATGRRFKAVQDVPMKTAVDIYSATVIYVGETKPGITTAQAFWRIERITTTGTEILIEFANGKDTFENIWANHVSLSYS